MKAIGIDVGGTQIKAGIVDSKGKIFKQINIETNPSSGKNSIISSIERIISKLDSKEIKSIGIGFAGSVDEKKGIIIESPNIPKMNNTKIVEALKKKIRKKIVLQNDAKLMALAEAKIGAGKKFSVIVGLTAGTGIGSGIIINKKIFSGKNNLTEIGHTTINFFGPKCQCGNTGCLEEYAGIKALMRLTERKMEACPSILKKMWPLTPKKIDEAAQKKDKLAISVLKETGMLLGIGLANIANSFNPDAIILGGGLSNSKIIFNEAVKEMKKRALKPAKNTKVLKARFREKAGMIGAGLLALEPN
ncbi:MAG: ROK family protein [archaeon]